MQNIPKIVSQRLKAAAPAVDHPDAGLLTAFAEHSLPDRERNGVLEHLARCGDCRDIVALALPETEAVQTVLRPSPSGWLTWPVLRWGFVAAGVVAIASFGVVQLQRRSQAVTMALKQSAEPDIAANEPKKAVAQFVAPASSAEKKEKLQIPAAPAFADSADGANATVIDKQSATRQGRIPEGGVSAQTKSGTNTFYGAAIGGPLPHGPRVANQWQQSNVSQNQISAPGQTAQASGSVSAIATDSAGSEVRLAQNSPAPQLPSGGASTYALSRAKPLASGAEGAINSQPGRGQLGLQPAPGQIAGYVVDPTGAVVSDARITITAANARATATAVTNSQGAWLVAGLPSGSYKAQAEAPGFRTTVLDLNYDAKQPSMYSFTLSPGSVSETVEVASAATQVQTDTSIGSAIADREASQPPMNGRDLKQMDALSPRGLPRWAISATGALQRSFDQGQTWQTVDVNANPLGANAASLQISAKASRVKAKDADKALKQSAAPLIFRALATNGADVWAGGSAGALYHSQDAGNHWIRVVPASAGTALSGDIVSLEFPDPQHGELSTSTPEVWTTTDAGQTWQKQ